MAFSNKTDLDKKNVKILRSYSRYFNIKQPYKIIIGPYFSQIVAEKRLSLLDSIRTVFIQRDCTLYTTRCCINDLQKLIDEKQIKFIRGAHILRTLKLLPCLHNTNKSINKNRWNCIDSIHCIKHYMNKPKYCFALQPRSFLGRVRNKPGIPCVWMYESVMVLDKLSKASQEYIKQHKNMNINNNNEESKINDFIEDSDNENENDNENVNYDVLQELKLDDEQNSSDSMDDNYNYNKLKHLHRKNVSVVRKTNLKTSVSGNVKSDKKYKFNINNRIRYGPDGGFDTMGIKMPKKKKRRTKIRSKRRKKRVDMVDKNEKSNNGNDNSIENGNEMTISKPQKSLSNWWKK